MKRIRVKARAQFQQRRHTAFALHLAPRRTDRAGRNLQQGALAGPVLADQSKSLSRLHGKIDSGQGHMHPVALPPGDPLQQAILRLGIDRVDFLHAFKANAHGLQRLAQHRLHGAEEPPAAAAQQHDP